jgi:phospholipid N-methyltransferase
MENEESNGKYLTRSHPLDYLSPWWCFVSVTTFDATYDPADDKLRLRASSRLDAETYAKVKAAGFGWAPKQDLFYAVWTPAREDLLVELAGDIGDEETSLEERAAQRAERFEGYKDKRAADAEQARKAVASIADGIPLGQPILVGHHSERHARKDAEKIENGMRRAVRLWETVGYWQQRAAGAVRAARYKELPAVRARRIRTLEADKRRHERDLKSSTAFLALWKTLDKDGSLKKKSGEPTTFQERAAHIANLDRSMIGLWSEIEHGKIVPAEAQTRAAANHDRIIADANRWISHLDNRLSYERTLLDESGYVPPPKPKTKAALPLLNYSGEVTVRDYRQNEPWTTTAIGIAKAEFAKIHPDYKGTRVSACGTHRVRTAMLKGRLCIVYLTDSKQHARPDAATVAAQAEADAAVREAAISRKLDESRKRMQASEAKRPEREQAAREAAPFEAIEGALRVGVQVAVAPQLFPTPPELAVRMVELAGIEAGDRVLEPSAGTGNLARAIRSAVPDAHLDLIEIDPKLCSILKASGFEVSCRDFLAASMPVCPDSEDGHDCVLMNPPFSKGQDVAHILHSLKFLKVGGRLVAICANGPRQQAELRPLAATWEELPDGTFADQGTNVRAVLMTVQR